jgi:AcrR family transcriptional regulator
LFEVRVEPARWFGGARDVPVIDMRVQNGQSDLVARPKEFDVDAALGVARDLFWDKGYEATTTEDLRQAIGIGRQSFYDTFGGKRDVFLAALRKYSDDRFALTAELLRAPGSPLAAVEKLLNAVPDETESERRRGCFGVSSMCELGTSDADAKALGAHATKRFLDELAATLLRAKQAREIRADVDERDAAAQLHATIVGMRVLAKGGATRALLRGIASSALRGLVG